MGLFSKKEDEINETKVYEMFEALTEEEKEKFKQRFTTDVTESAEPVKEPEPTTEPVKEPEVQPKEKTDGFMEMFNKLKAEQDDKIKALTEEVAELKKSQPRPFGYTEKSKVYKATEMKPETSEDYIKKLFG